MKRIVTLLLFALPFWGYAQARKDSINSSLDTTRNLNEVSINGSIPQRLHQAPGNLAIVDVKPFYSSNITPVQLLRGASGVKIKQDGGYGSRIDLFINGSTGKQIKFFTDGLPMDNMGESIRLNNLPVEQIDRIEIYKGVIPVDLGADVLGGAINIVTRKERESYLDASYAIGSFNTHRINLSGRKRWTANFYTGLQLYQGYSKNNYTVDVENINASSQLEAISVKRFHDEYKNLILKGELGIINKPWADELMLTLSGSGLRRELQNNLTMTQPYAHARYGEELYRGLLKYQKNDLFKRTNLLAFASYSRVNGLLIDTSSNVITWDQRVAYRRLKGAELGPAAFRNITTNAFDSKIVASYWLTSNSKLILSNTLQYFRRNSKDTLAQRLNGGQDLIGAPVSQLKNVTGIGADVGLFRDRLKLSAALKNFYMNLHGSSVKFDKQFDASNRSNYTGYNLAAAFPLSPALTLKLSFEHAVRLPDDEEAFGNFMLVNPNPDLKAEESNNVNVNALYHDEKLDIELTGFFRGVDHLIFLVPNSQGSAKAYNLLKANITGVEAALNYRLSRAIVLNINATYQDLRNKSYIENEGIPNERYVDQRLPNIPYLLANAGINYRKANVAGTGRQLHVWYNANFTNRYFLYWANDGDPTQKNIIPTQLLQNAGVSVTKNNLSFSLESYNLAGVKTYDNFRLQLPGRSISFKTRYYLSSKKSNN